LVIGHWSLVIGHSDLPQPLTVAATSTIHNRLAVPLQPNPGSLWILEVGHRMSRIVGHPLEFADAAKRTPRFFHLYLNR
jgi:hypothetical protein